ncbi:MAG: ribonuclease III [Candidatus Aminicenantes bacterium]|jgi:ribonuclease-3
MKINIAQCEKRLGYTFKNQDLLLQALTHSSYAYENQKDDISDNEVLEFLGDSVLGLIIADFLCSNYPDLSEGELSKLKSAAASTSALDYFAKKAKLDRCLRLGKGEDKSGGRKKKTILAGAYEAVIAAIYLDGGIEPARDFVLNFLRSLFKRINIKKFFVDNYKSALQEYLQKENAEAPIYKTVTMKGPDHKRSFVVEVFAEDKLLAKAKGNSKKEAEKKAAQKALKGLLGRKIKTLTTDTFFLKKKT